MREIKYTTDEGQLLKVTFAEALNRHIMYEHQIQKWLEETSVDEPMFGELVMYRTFSQLIARMETLESLTEGAKPPFDPKRVKSRKEDCRAAFEIWMNMAQDFSDQCFVELSTPKKTQAPKK